MTRPTIEDVRAAAVRIEPIAHRTPVLSSRSFNATAGIDSRSAARRT
jgi:hypothetical protein